MDETGFYPVLVGRHLSQGGQNGPKSTPGRMRSISRISPFGTSAPRHDRRRWSPCGRCVATQLDVVLGEEHHADILKGALNGVDRHHGRLPTFQFEIVDCAFAD
jgi:hypothetical protein